MLHRAPAACGATVECGEYGSLDAGRLPAESVFLISLAYGKFERSKFQGSKFSNLKALCAGEKLSEELGRRKFSQECK